MSFPSRWVRSSSNSLGDHSSIPQAKYCFDLSALIGSVNSFPSKSDSLTASFPNF